jgi:hypothetical protein
MTLPAKIEKSAERAGKQARLRNTKVTYKAERGWFSLSETATV